jgi:8-oxo-dGTP diphosphatase
VQRAVLLYIVVRKSAVVLIKLLAREHEALAWVKPVNFDDYPMPPADAPLAAWLRDLI